MSHYHPRPMNQFNRLIGTGPVTGTFVLGTRWNNISHGKNWDSENCTATAGAIAIDAHTGGRIKSSPNAIRNNQGDWSGGIGIDDVNDAWAKLWPGNQLLTPRNTTWAEVISYLKQGRGILIQGDYDQVPYGYQCQKGGRFDHAFFLGDHRVSDGRVLYYDTLCRHAMWVPQSTIRGAAEKLALAQRGSRGDLFVGLTKVIPPPPSAPLIKWRCSVPASYWWDYDISSSGRITGRVRRKTGGFSAPCSPPKTYTWPGHGTRTLVRVFAPSVYAGAYISASLYAEEDK